MAAFTTRFGIAIDGNVGFLHPKSWQHHHYVFMLLKLISCSKTLTCKVGEKSKVETKTHVNLDPYVVVFTLFVVSALRRGI